MGVMTRDQILGTPKAGFTEIDLGDLPGWGAVRIKDLTAGERDRIEASCVVERLVIGKGGKRKLKKETSLEGIRAKFVAACVVDENGLPIFRPEDVTAISELNAKAIDRIFTAIQERNGLREEDLDELAGNFSAGQSDA
jgi:hypothetical protein